MENILDEIKQERIRQNNKWGEQNHSPIEWMAILMEEVGEVSKEALEHHFKYPNKSGEFSDEIQESRMENYREELIQVAAVASQMVECYDRNK